MKRCSLLVQKKEITFFIVFSNNSNLDCDQSFFFFRFSKGSARERVQSRAFSHARGHLRVSRVLLDGPRKKRDCS